MKELPTQLSGTDFQTHDEHQLSAVTSQQFLAIASANTTNEVSHNSTLEEQIQSVKNNVILTYQVS